MPLLCLRRKVIVSFLLALLLTLTYVAGARAQTPSPSPQSYRGASGEFEYAGTFSDVVDSINAFWEAEFRKARRSYSSPGVVALDQIRDTGCGRHGPEMAAFYCQLDSTIYLDPGFLTENHSQFGDYAPIIVLAHEWGHHLQNLLHVPDPGGNTFELQADCLAGVYTLYAEEHGRLDLDDFVEAIQMSESGGDPIWFPQDAPGAHGTNIDRRRAVLRGYLDGVTGCQLFPAFTPTPTPTFQIPFTPTPTATPNPTTHLLELPSTLPLPHASCFRIESDGPFTYNDVFDRLGGSGEDAAQLLKWRWSAGTYRTFACDGPSDSEVGWVEINAHLFADATAAQEAVDYFAAVRAEGTRLVFGPSPAIGDHAVSLAGQASNGSEVTIYASSGPRLVRVTGVAPSGIPFMNVLTVARAVLATEPGSAQTGEDKPQSEPTMLPAVMYLPSAPAVNYAECFQVLTEGPYSYADVASALQEWGMPQSEIDALGWQDGSYRVFTCADPPYGRVAHIEVIIHRFQDAESAPRAAPYFAGTYEVRANESRSCDTANSLVICVLGRSLTGSPLSDVHFVLQNVVSAARD